jgi:hypothetical protein
MTIDKDQLTPSIIYFTASVSRGEKLGGEVRRLDGQTLMISFHGRGTKEPDGVRRELDIALHSLALAIAGACK